MVTDKLGKPNLNFDLSNFICPDAFQQKFESRRKKSLIAKILTDLQILTRSSTLTLIQFAKNYRLCTNFFRMHFGPKFLLLLLTGGARSSVDAEIGVKMTRQKCVVVVVVVDRQLALHRCKSRFRTWTRCVKTLMHFIAADDDLKKFAKCKRLRFKDGQVSAFSVALTW